MYRGLEIFVTESSEQKVGSTLVWGEGEIRVVFFGYLEQPDNTPILKWGENKKRLNFNEHILKQAEHTLY